MRCYMHVQHGILILWELRFADTLELDLHIRFDRSHLLSSSRRSNNIGPVGLVYGVGVSHRLPQVSGMTPRTKP